MLERELIIVENLNVLEINPYFQKSKQTTKMDFEYLIYIVLFKKIYLLYYI
jgi:hypothetical protein